MFGILRDYVGTRASNLRERDGENVWLFELLCGASGIGVGVAGAGTDFAGRALGLTELLPGRNADADRVYEGISEGCRPAEAERLLEGERE